MSTPAQILANQQNAQNSTGPRTPEGKATVAQNATKHGLAATYPVIRSEEEQTQFETMHLFKNHLKTINNQLKTIQHHSNQFNTPLKTNSKPIEHLLQTIIVQSQAIILPIESHHFPTNKTSFSD